jgi:hypothetical protein
MKFFVYLLFPLFVLQLNTVKHPDLTVKSCGPATYAFRATITSVQSGNWSDPATWGGRAPAAGDAPTISAGHTVFADIDAAVAGMQITGILMFDPSTSVTITSTKNILVAGLLEMLSPRPAVIQTIRFVGVNENSFVGGGMDPVATDVGIWVTGAGRLHLQGADKTSWSNSADAIGSGATTITVNDAAGWQPGDELIISPTLAGSQQADNVTVNSINGLNVGLKKGVSSTHPLINNRWTAEVGNLTRNVRIEGTAAGRSHVFIRSTSPQYIRNVAFRYLGSRKDQNGDNIKDLVLGRYGIHFHHCDDGSDGSMVQGCVMRDIGNHAYVPHVSHGIEFRDNIAFNCTEAPFWWDLPDATHRSTWVHNLVVQPNYVFHSMDFDTPGSQELGVHAFVLGMGDDNRCDSNVVAGQVSDATINAAYDWEEMNIESAWGFKGNTVHNSEIGIRSWQNNGKNHVLEQTVIYNCATGVLHGAYVNNYTYQGGYLYNAVFEDHAASAANGVRIENMTLDGAGLVDYPFHIVSTGPAPGERPILIRSCVIKGGKKGAILDESADNVKSVDVIQSDITGAVKVSSGAKAGETIRVQPVGSQPYKVTKSGKSNIAAFAPASWGSGTGLQGQYFDNTDFTNLVETRIDPLINFPEWQIPLPGAATGVHHLVTDAKYSIRWTGYIEPQFNEAYKFSLNTGGGSRLWIDGKLIIDKWSEVYPTTYTSSSISLQAGKRYSIRLEYFNNDDRSALYLYWQSASLKKELVPQSQLYIQ